MKGWKDAERGSKIKQVTQIKAKDIGVGDDEVKSPKVAAVAFRGWANGAPNLNLSAQNQQKAPERMEPPAAAPGGSESRLPETVKKRKHEEVKENDVSWNFVSSKGALPNGLLKLNSKVKRPELQFRPKKEKNVQAPDVKKKWAPVSLHS